MSFKHIQELLELAKRLKGSFEKYNVDNIQKYLKELFEYNTELYDDEKEEVSWMRSTFGLLKPKDKYMFSLFSANSRDLKVVKKNLSKVKKCIKTAAKMIKRLEDVKDQTAVIKELVADELKPFLNQRGFGKKGNTFYKRGRRYTKYLRVYPSRNNTFVDAQFAFEFWIIDEQTNRKITIGKNVEDDRVSSLKEDRQKEQFYHFDPYTDMSQEKAKVMEDLEAILKYFDRFD